ncbi:MAG: hypothetical protein NTY61_03610 [Candidatus Parcubacteria bacterium]|nr:hypothetical protein [Candidatus Parcubacteria bacterium]
MPTNKLPLWSLLHAIGVAIYVTLVALVMQNGEKIFGQMNNLWGPAALLMLFVSSAAITGALVLGKPVLFYLDGQKSEAVKMFGYTLGWLVVLTVVVFLIQGLR